MFERIRRAILILLGRRIPAVKIYEFSSRIKFDKLPKNEWIAWRSKLYFDEVNNTWLEDVQILCKKGRTGKTFSGKLDDLQIWTAEEL